MARFSISRSEGLPFLSPFFEDFLGLPPRERPRGDLMKADIREDDTHFIIDIDVPSVNKEDIKIELEQGYLTVRAHQNYENDSKDKKGKYIRRERYTGSYSRSFYVGEEVSNDDISASLKNGTLSLSIKKIEEKKPPKSYIEIE